MSTSRIVDSNSSLLLMVKLMRLKDKATGREKEMNLLLNAMSGGSRIMRMIMEDPSITNSQEMTEERRKLARSWLQSMTELGSIALEQSRRFIEYFEKLEIPTDKESTKLHLFKLEWDELLKEIEIFEKDLESLIEKRSFEQRTMTEFLDGLDALKERISKCFENLNSANESIEQKIDTAFAILAKTLPPFSVVYQAYKEKI